jgi:asparagine synthase (glutamine-hydrolysing)
MNIGILLNKYNLFFFMKLGVLFSGGKDSTYAAYLMSKKHEISCLITVYSENEYSYMFHTPAITKVKMQASAMEVPLVEVKTKGVKEDELKDLEKVILIAKKKYRIEGIVTGAVASVYQASRIQKICDKLKLKVFNPLWHKNQVELLNELIKNKFEVVIVGVAAEGLDGRWLGRKIDKKFISDIEVLNKKVGLNVAGEGGEFESLVLNCPLFKKKLEIIGKKIVKDDGNYKLEIELG